MVGGNASQHSETSSSSRRRFLKIGATGVALTMTSLAGCAGDGGEDTTTTDTGTTIKKGDPEMVDTMNLYTFGGVNAKGINKAFVQSFQDKYGVKVNHQTIASGWDIIPKIKNGSAKAHVVEHNPDSTLGGIKQGVWQPIRLDNIPTITNRLLYDRLKGSSEYTTFDPGNDWNYVPKELWGQGMVYNTDQLDYTKEDPPTSWNDIYTNELKSKLTNTLFTALAIGVAASEIGVNFNKINKKSNLLEKIWDRVKFETDYVYQWWDSGSTAQQLLTRESALAGNFWYGRVATLRLENDVPIWYTVPKEGTVHGISVWTIGVEDDPDRYTAEKFIDHTAKPKPRGVYANYIPYFTPYKPRIPSDAAPAYKNNPDMKNFERLRLWDYKLVSEHQKEWQKKFRRIIRS